MDMTLTSQSGGAVGLDMTLTSQSRAKSGLRTTLTSQSHAQPGLDMTLTSSSDFWGRATASQTVQKACARSLGGGFRGPVPTCSSALCVFWFKADSQRPQLKRGWPKGRQVTLTTETWMAERPTGDVSKNATSPNEEPQKPLRHNESGTDEPSQIEPPMRLSLALSVTTGSRVLAEGRFHRSRRGFHVTAVVVPASSLGRAASLARSAACSV